MADNARIQLELHPVLSANGTEPLPVQWRAVLEVQVSAVGGLPFGVLVDGAPDVDPRVAVATALRKAADAFSVAVPFRRTV